MIGIGKKRDESEKCFIFLSLIFTGAKHFLKYIHICIYKLKRNKSKNKIKLKTEKFKPNFRSCLSKYTVGWKRKNAVLFTPGEVLRLSVKEQHYFRSEFSKHSLIIWRSSRYYFSILLPGKLRHRDAK